MQTTKIFLQRKFPDLGVSVLLLCYTKIVHALIIDVVHTLLEAITDVEMLSPTSLAVAPGGLSFSISGRESLCT